MMMMGERSQLNLSVHAPPWSVLPVCGITGESNGGYLVGDPPLSPLQLFDSFDGESDDPDLSDAPVNAYACDEFRMYEFKVRRCARGRSHDWTECPYAHPGEKARRRDPRRFRYSGTACPDFRKGTCRRGDACEFAHGVFECWLHPERYRTQPCKDGTACRRRVCFFAHTPDQLRVLTPALQLHSPRSAAVSPDSYDGSPLRRRESPPMSPMGGSCVNEILASLRNLRLSRSLTGSWGFPVGGEVAGSPRDWGAVGSGFCSLPVTPKRSAVSGGGAGGAGWLEGGLDMGFLEEEEPVERVESGRALRAKMVERLSKENGIEVSGSGPDLGWVSELVK